MALGIARSGAILAVTITAKNTGRNNVNAAANAARYAAADCGAPPVCAFKLNRVPYSAQNAMTPPTLCQVNPCEQRARNRRAATKGEDTLTDATAVSAAPGARGGAELNWGNTLFARTLDLKTTSA
jgi:hypothetical protein